MLSASELLNNIVRITPAARDLFPTRLSEWATFMEEKFLIPLDLDYMKTWSDRCNHCSSACQLPAFTHCITYRITTFDRAGLAATLSIRYVELPDERHAIDFKLTTWAISALSARGTRLLTASYLTSTDAHLTIEEAFEDDTFNKSFDTLMTALVCRANRMECMQL